MVLRPDWPEPWLLPEKYKSKAERAIARSKAKRAARPGNCEQHLIAVRQLWCSLGSPDDREVIHCHHLQGGPFRNRGLGRRAPDKISVVPLSFWRHEELHALGSRHEYAYFMDHSKGRVDPYDLAIKLGAVSPGLRLMMNILYAHQNQDRHLMLLSLSKAELDNPMMGHNGGPSLKR